MESKPLWQSKTVLLSVLLGLTGILGSLGIIPSVNSWAQGHQDILLTGIGAVGLVLRLVTSGKISIS
jgi:hypothetical protein